MTTFVDRAFLSDPDKGLATNVQNEDVVAVQLGHGDLSLGLFGDHQLACLVRAAVQHTLQKMKMRERAKDEDERERAKDEDEDERAKDEDERESNRWCHHYLVAFFPLVVVVVLRSDGSLASQQSPEVLDIGLSLSVGLTESNARWLTASLVIDSLHQSAGFDALSGTAFGALPLVELHACVQHEDISAVERLVAHRHLHHTHVLAALDVQQTRLVFGGLDVVETTLDSTLQNTDTSLSIR